MHKYHTFLIFISFISFIDYSISFDYTNNFFYLIALYTDSLTRAYKSAPHHPYDCCPTYSSAYSLIWWFFNLFYIIFDKIPNLSSLQGNDICILTSNRPALKIAASTKSIRFVAATTITLSNWENPSISLKNWLIVEVVSWVSLKWFKRLPNASI